jgi:hypothetical protein
MESGQQSPVADGAESVASKGAPKKKFLNGWTKELEQLMADWADKAACYRWMHEKTSLLYSGRDRLFNIPVIILSGLTAGANFALNSITGDDKDMQKWAQLGLGGASLITGIIQTFMNFYGYAKGSEAHRVSGISWGKFSRLLCIEMNLHPDERMDALNFLKMFRVELDRLIEQSPPIPQNIIDEFNAMFKNANVVKPEITGILEHTKVYRDDGSRLKRLAAEATIALSYKKGILKQLVIDDIEGKMRKTATEAATETAKQIAKEIIDSHKAVLSPALTKIAMKNNMAETDLKQERKAEIIDTIKQKSFSVQELTQRFKKIPPSGPLPSSLKKEGSFRSNNGSPAIRINKEVMYSDFTLNQPENTTNIVENQSVSQQNTISENIIVEIQPQETPADIKEIPTPVQQSEVVPTTETQK